MAITIKQENNGFRNIIEINYERWSYLTKDELQKTIDFLINYRISFKVEYSFELFHIVINDSKYSIGGNKNDSEEADKLFNVFLIKLISEKNKGVRPVI